MSGTQNTYCTQNTWMVIHSDFPRLDIVYTCCLAIFSIIPLFTFISVLISIKCVVTIIYIHIYGSVVFLASIYFGKLFSELLFAHK